MNSSTEKIFEFETDILISAHNQIYSYSLVNSLNNIHQGIICQRNYTVRGIKTVCSKAECSMMFLAKQ